jgi:hypothetical protein
MIITIDMNNVNDSNNNKYELYITQKQFNKALISSTTITEMKNKLKSLYNIQHQLEQNITKNSNRLSEYAMSLLNHATAHNWE